MSPVLGKLFEEKVTEGNPLKLDLQDKTYDDMVEFLKCIYPNILKKVTLGNVFVVLPLAVEFEVDELKQRCEDVLLENAGRLTKTEHILEYLCKADKYNLVELRKKCINEATKKSSQALQKAEKKVPLPVQVKVEIQNIMIDSMEKQMAEQKRQTEDQKRHTEDQKQQTEAQVLDLKRRNLQLTKYENIAKSTNMVALFKTFGETIMSANLKNPRVGFVESSFSLSDDHGSNKTIIHGMQWYLSLEIIDENVGLFLHARPLEAHCRHKWQCKVYGVLRLHNYKNDKDSICETVNEMFSSVTSPAWGCREFAKKKAVEGKEAGFLNQEDEVKVEAYVLTEEPNFF